MSTRELLRLVLLGTIGAIVVGCASAQPKTTLAPYDLKQETETALRNYRDCAYESADGRVPTPAMPADIAEAALADCATWYTRLQFVSSDWFASLVSRRSEFEARRQSDEQIIQTRDNLRRALISRVLTARSPTSSSQPQR